MCESDNMPCSEDDDSQSGFMSESGQGLSKAELRKTNKPIMEKKRRARINNCLNELKDLLTDAMDKDPARHSKLEKADILELTVKHLQTLQRNQLAAAIASDPTVLHRFKAGFGDCAVEVRRYLSRLANVPTGVRHRLGSHLNHCIAGMDHPLSQDIPQLVPDPLRLDDERPSAFHFVRNARLSSPPLSPMSCGSACDSSTELETPPRQTQTFPFPTPPSRSASDQDSSPETQKPTVSSTTISPDTLKKEAAKKFMEPLSIVIDVENYKIGIDASPKRAVDYSIRQKLKRSVVDNVGPAQKVIRMEPATERTTYKESFVEPKKLERIVPVTDKLPAFEIRVLDRTSSLPERPSFAEPKMPIPNRLSSVTERPLSMPELKLTVPESIPSVAERPVFERGFLGPVKFPVSGTVISHTAESLAKSSIAKKQEVKVKTEAEGAQRPRSRSPGQGPSGSTDMWRPW